MAETSDRRELHFDSFDDVIAEAELLASGETRVVGNHSFAEILHHLGLSFDTASGRATPPPAPFFMKLMRPLIRMMVLNDKPLSPGVKLPARGESFFWPRENFDVATEIAYLKEAVAHYQNNGHLENHPFFGKLSREQSDSLNLRHSALHLGFVHPMDSAAT